MKKISVLLGLLLLLCANFVFAAGAVVTSVTGSAQAQTGTAAPRVLREGDTVNQGETVFTGGGSAVVLRFDDGQVAALTANSRMTVTAYDYNQSSGGGNILLSLVTGGMRAITGLIGHRNPSSVTYRAATATIGIRGTDVTFATNGTDVLVTVADGAVDVTVSVNGTKYTVSAGQALFFSVRTGVVTGTNQAVLNNPVVAGSVVATQVGSTNTISLSPTGGPITSTSSSTQTQVTITSTQGGGSSGVSVQ